MAAGRKTGGRQKGVPNKATAEIKSIAREYGEAAIRKTAQLAGLIEGKPAASSEAAQVAALSIIMERGYGKATQVIAGDDEGGPIKVTRIELVAP